MDTSPGYRRVLEAADDLAVTVHTASRRLVASRAPGLQAQLVRAADAIAAHIADDRQQSGAPCLTGLAIARGSAHEVGTHLRRARQTGALDPIAVQRCEAKRRALCRLLSILIRRIEERQACQERAGCGRRSRRQEDR